MKTGTKIAIWSLSVITTAGFGYFIWSRIKIARLNKQITDVSIVQQEVDNLDISNVDIPADVSTTPDLPMPNADFSSDSNNAPDSSSNLDYYNSEYGYY